MSESRVVAEREKQRKVLPALRLEREGRSSPSLVSQVEKGITGLAKAGQLDPGVVGLILRYNRGSFGSLGLLGFTCVLGSVN